MFYAVNLVIFSENRVRTILQKRQLSEIGPKGFTHKGLLCAQNTKKIQPSIKKWISL